MHVPREVLASIPEHHRAKLLKELDLNREKLPIERALGIQRNTERDSFTCKVTIENRASTRRGILSIVSSIYDPLLFLSPFILKAKQILQGLKQNLRPNDLIVIVDDTAPRNSWLMDHVVKTLPVPKGLVRSVFVKTKNNILQQPVDKLCMLLEQWIELKGIMCWLPLPPRIHIWTHIPPDS